MKAKNKNNIADVLSDDFDITKIMSKDNSVIDKEGFNEFEDVVIANHLADISTNTFDADNAFSEFSSKVNEIKKTDRRFFSLLKPLYKYAALILISLSIGYYFVNDKMVTADLVNLEVPNGEHSYIGLPDGSKIWINSATSLAYNEDFVQEERIVKLSGEAYFEVAELDGKPFIVELDDNSRIRVLGTAFNIKSYEEDSKIKVTLLEGSVQFIHENNKNQKIDLSPGNSIIVNKKNKEIELLENTDTNSAISWKNNDISYNKEYLIDIVNDLNRVYDVSISIKSKTLENQLFTASFEKESEIDAILNALAVSGKFIFNKFDSNQYEIFVKPSD